MADAGAEPAGPSIQASKLSARAARAEWCPSAEEDGSIPLPPEQRGKIGRYLADDEGEVPGRWMDVPMPNEIWGGAVGLTRAMVECVLLPIPGVPEFTPSGGLPPQRPKREPLVPEGTELEERAPQARATPADDGASGAAGAASGDESDDGYRADCVTRAPDPSCVPGEPAASGPKVRSAKAKMTYFREDPDGTIPTPQECFADLGTFSVQAADHFCPIQLFIPGPPPAEGRGYAEVVQKAPPAPPAAGAVPWPPKAEGPAQAEGQAEPADEAPHAAPAAAHAEAAARADEAEPPAALPPP